MISDTIRLIRQNHALEHATISLLLEQGLSPPLCGYSLPRGFLIFSKASTEDISSAAHRALSLLNKGNTELAISPYCGTNLAVAALATAGAASMAITAVNKKERVGYVSYGLMAALGVIMVKRLVVGKTLQRYCTTLPKVEDVEIVRVVKTWGEDRSLHTISTRRRKLSAS